MICIHPQAFFCRCYFFPSSWKKLLLSLYSLFPLSISQYYWITHVAHLLYLLALVSLHFSISFLNSVLPFWFLCTFELTSNLEGWPSWSKVTDLRWRFKSFFTRVICWSVDRASSNRAPLTIFLAHLELTILYCNR